MHRVHVLGFREWCGLRVEGWEEKVPACCALAPCHGHSMGAGGRALESLRLGFLRCKMGPKMGFLCCKMGRNATTPRLLRWWSLPLPLGTQHLRAPGSWTPRRAQRPPRRRSLRRPRPSVPGLRPAPPARLRRVTRGAQLRRAGGRRRWRRPASERHGGGGDHGGPGGARAHAELRAARAAQLGQRGGGGAGLRGLRLGAGAPGPDRARAPGAPRAAAAGARRARLDRAALGGHHAPLSGQCGWGPGHGLGDPGPLCTPFCLCELGPRTGGPRAVGALGAESWAAPRPFLSVRDGGGDGCGGVAGPGNPRCWVPDTGGVFVMWGNRSTTHSGQCGTGGLSV